MKHAKRSKPLRVARIALALLVALAASTAQDRRPSRRRTGEIGTGSRRRYGPVLHPQPIRSEPGAQPEQTPQAQEEKADAAPAGRRALDPDPSARPAPQPKDPAKPDDRKDGKKASKRSARRRPRCASIPWPWHRPRCCRHAGHPPATRAPGPVQINSCLGGTCTDTNWRDLQHGRRQCGRQQPGPPVHPHWQHHAMLLIRTWFSRPKIRYNPEVDVYVNVKKERDKGKPCKFKTMCSSSPAARRAWAQRLRA